MGNLQRESGLKPTNVEDQLEPKIGYNDATYTAAVDSGKITRAQFLNPLPGRVYGYGLAQWTSTGRKAGLYDLCKRRGVSIGDLETQLDWLLAELRSEYKTVFKTLTNTSDVRTASNIVLTRFEMPADQSAAVKNARYASAMVYYDAYAAGTDTTPAAVPEAGKVSADDVLGIARAWIGYSEADGRHRRIVDLYNAHKPLARGYAVSYSDAWCDTFVSAVFIKAGAVDLIGGTECGCEEHVRKFKAAGIWIEDGTITPRAGDIILFNWDKSAQPNDGTADHIGFVETVSGKTITTIEGNKNDAVGRRVLTVGSGSIRGYARPKYGTGAAKVVDTVEPDCYFVRMGSFSGQQVNSFHVLTNAKKDCDAHPGSFVFDADGKILYPAKAEEKTEKKTEKKTGTGKKKTGLNKEIEWTGTVTASMLSVRTWAGVQYPELKSLPEIPRGTKVGVCDTVKDIDGADWYYAKIGDIYGFVFAGYVKK